MRRSALAWAFVWALAPAAAAGPLVLDLSSPAGLEALTSPATEYYRLYSAVRGPALTATVIEILPGKPRPPEEPPYPRDQAVLVLTGGLDAWRESQGPIKTSYGHFKFVRAGQKREQRRVGAGAPMYVLTISGGRPVGKTSLPKKRELELARFAERRWKEGFDGASRTDGLFSLPGFDAAMILVRAPGRPADRAATERLWFVLDGTGRVLIDGAVAAVKPKTLIRVPAGASASAEPDGRLSVLQIRAH